MKTSEHFWWLARQAFECLHATPFLIAITVVLLIGVLLSAARHWWDGGVPGQHRALLALLQFLLPWLILVVGTIWRAPSPREMYLPTLLLFAIIVLHFVAIGLLLTRLPNGRLFAFATFLLVSWISVWAFFVSAMSVSGDWV